MGTTSNTITGRTIARTVNGNHYLITAELVHLQGNERPYFSVTADAWYAQGKLTGYQRMRRHYEQDAGGCMHEEIVAIVPELAPIIHVHLADDDGVPMHAFANGWYFYSGKAREWEEGRGEAWHNREGLTDRERAARALHLDVDQVPEGMDRDQFSTFFATLTPIWREQADAARAAIEALR